MQKVASMPTMHQSLMSPPADRKRAAGEEAIKEDPGEWVGRCCERCVILHRLRRRPAGVPSWRAHTFSLFLLQMQSSREKRGAALTPMPP